MFIMFVRRSPVVSFARLAQLAYVGIWRKIDEDLDGMSEGGVSALQRWEVGGELDSERSSPDVGAESLLVGLRVTAGGLRQLRWTVGGELDSERSTLEPAVSDRSGSSSVA